MLGIIYCQQMCFECANKNAHTQALGCTCAVGPIASTDVSQIECIAANPKKGVSI
jgi:hypothetical protein